MKTRCHDLSTRNGIGFKSLEYRSSTLLILCAAVHLLVGCRTSPVVHATAKSLQKPFQHIDAPPCRPRKRTVKTEKGPNSVAFNLLNSELIACQIDTRDDAVEPGWTVETWYDETDVYGEDQDKRQKQKTSLLFKQLFQSDPQGSATGKKQPPPPSGAGGRVTTHLVRDPSLTLFNVLAMNEIANQFRNWPSSPGTIRPRLNATPFSQIPDAKAMKLEFQEVELKPNQKSYEVPVVLDKNQGEKSKFVKMNTTYLCTGAAHAGTPADPIPMNCFYYVVVHVLPGDTGPQHRFSYRRDYLMSGTDLDMNHDKVYLLRGFHLIKADHQDAWTWSTFWWTPQRRKDSFCKESSSTWAPGCDVPWAFYEMDEQRYHTIKEKPAAHFNPYIETHVGQSNCIYCHARALYHYQAKPARNDDFSSAQGYTAGSLLPCFAAESPSKPAALSSSSSDVDCNDATPTHFLWSLAKHLKDHPPPTQQPK